MQNDICVCPSANATVEEESQPEETSPVANPACTTGNASACKDAAGSWDPIECVCSFAQIEETEEDVVKEDFIDKNVPQEGFDEHMAEMYPILSKNFDMYSRHVKVGTATFATIQVVAKIADSIYYWDDSDWSDNETDDMVLRESGEEEDCDEEEYGWYSEFYSYGNMLALDFFATHFILSELYRRDKVDALFQVYLKYSHVAAAFTLLTYAYEVLWFNYSAIVGFPIFVKGYQKYRALWRSVDKYTDARQAMRYIEKYGGQKQNAEEGLDEFETPEDFPEEGALL